MLDQDTQRSSMSQFFFLACFIALLSYGAKADDTETTTYSPDEQATLGGAAHECYRECVKGDTRKCYYSFTLTTYTTMSLSCGNCPYVVEDCYNTGCIPGDGHTREVNVINRMLPGPSIQVCEDDEVIIDVINSMEFETTTLHWHGMNQRGTPFMDGSPFVTMCPIHSYTSFQYDYFASPAGTHFYHSHLGMTEADGLNGLIVVRKADDPLAEYYDYDLAEHVVSVYHWFNITAVYYMKETLAKGELAEGFNMVINGMSPSKEFIQNGTSYHIPRRVFEVKQGYKYRFRLLYSTTIYCPTQVSIDNHTMLVIASDSGTFEPIEVDSLVIGSAERYDFVVNADKPIGNYWIRFRSFGICESNKITQSAILRYADADESDPPGTTTWDDANVPGRLLNPVQEATLTWENNTVTRIVDLNNTLESAVDVSGTPDHRFYLNISLNTYPGYYMPGPWPQFNGLTYIFPPFPALTQYEEITDDIYCSATNLTNQVCNNGFCSCPITYDVTLNSLVELIVVDAGLSTINDDHPMHLHGQPFRVVAMGTIGGNVTNDQVKALDEAGLIERRLDNPLVKDTAAVPAHGYLVLRFRASNPGYWFFHCHILDHVVVGQAIVFKVGEDSDMAHPSKDFPRCGNWKQETSEK